MVPGWLPLLLEAGDLDHPFATPEVDDEVRRMSAATVDRYLAVNGQVEVPIFGQLKVSGLHGGSGLGVGASVPAPGLAHAVCSGRNRPHWSNAQWEANAMDRRS
jgi:hypothetical protein